MVDIEVLVRSVSGNRLSDEPQEDAEVFFDVKASVVETSRESGKLSIKFSIKMETQPSVANIMVEGTAVVRGEEQDIDALLVGKDPDGAPAMFMKIYQRVYAVLYLLCASLRVPYPSPTLLKKVEVSSQPAT